MATPADRRARPRARFDWPGYLAIGRERWLGIIVAAAFTAGMLLPDPGPLPALRFWAFDTYQVWLPRERTSDAVVIVNVDDRSILEVGQWPWPRDIIALLIDRIAARRPAVIGIDILFSEPDRSSPERIAQSLGRRDRVVAEHLAKMRPNDEILAESIARAPVVLGVAGVDASKANSTFTPRAKIEGPMPRLLHHTGAFRSLPIIDRAAKGHGVLNADPERGIVRSIPAVVSLAGEPVLTLGLESVRIGANAPGFILKSTAAGLTSVEVGEFSAPVQPNGRAWIHFARHDPRRFVSASDILEGRDDPERIKGRVALVGVTALAVLDRHTTARRDNMSGIEIHAQLVESVDEDRLLTRPAWARYIEASAFALAGGLLVLRVPRTRMRRSFPMLVGYCALLIVSGASAFQFAHTLFDPLAPVAGAALLYGLMLSATLVATERQRRQLSARLAAEREAAARVTGELEAARRIQMGILPTRESALKNERRIEIFAHMKAAREVGGDLYDFFPVTDDKFVVLVGDVSDKGLPAAMFMAVSKALGKSCALRASVGAAQLMMTFNEELSRENPEEMFVTLVALIIDLRTGALEYCNAGHELPILVRRSGETLILGEGGGPPLCVVDGYPYEEAYAKLEPRDVLALVSDGLTEAMDKSRALYGRARLKAMLESPARRGLDLTILGSEILAGIRTFEGGAEPADDQTLLLFSWRGAG